MTLLNKGKSQPNPKAYADILKAIKKYPKIVVFRHVIPDFDALGTQLGVATWIKENFPSKQIKVVGEDHPSFTPRLYPKMQKVSDKFFDKKTLCLIVDTANMERIDDPRYNRGGMMIKVDHHPNVNPFGDICLVDTTTCAASELWMKMILSYGPKYRLSKKTATYFYSGIAGDSGRFMYKSTTPQTFAIAKVLLETGINAHDDVYLKMYEKTLEDLKITAYLLNHYHVSPKGVAYYVLSHQEQTELDMLAKQGKDNVNLFSNIKDIHIWCSISEDIKDHVWRVSIRSKKVSINQIAQKYQGGGHAQASGCKLTSLDELPKLIADLDKLLK
jgi:bifunctional oligoribonuclease and PAP phosphatase NrnA